VLPERRNNLCLVEAVAEDIKDDDKETKTTLRVMKIFIGSETLNNRKFVHTSFRVTPMTRVYEREVALVKGQRSLWTVQESKDGLIHVASEAWEAWGMTLPMVESEKEYKSAIQTATTIQKIASSPASEQIVALSKWVESDNGLRSAWAVGVLTEWSPKHVESFSEGLAENRKIPLEGKIAVDKAMLHIDRKRWLNAKERLSTLSSLANNPGSANEANILLNYLNNTGKQDLLDSASTLEYLDRIAVNTKLDPATRQFAVSVIGHQVENNRSGVFGLLLKYVSNADSGEIGCSAAKTIHNEFNLNEKEYAALKAVRDQLKDKKVSAAVDEALAKRE